MNILQNSIDKYGSQVGSPYYTDYSWFVVCGVRKPCLRCPSGCAVHMVGTRFCASAARGVWSAQAMLALSFRVCRFGIVGTRFCASAARGVWSAQAMLALSFRVCRPYGRDALLRVRRPSRGGCRSM
jgi:hypothetical protein